MRIYATSLSVLLMSVPFAAKSQTEASDSVRTHELQELVVEGRTQRVIKFGVEYIPDKKTKKTSLDATSLLLHMQIPQLAVTPGTTTVTTASGKGVAMYIDYAPATEQDLQGLRPEDVVRVEVLNYPDDPRFQSAPHVVNFIMVHYEWGGYTKFSLQGRTLADNNTYGDVYSKFVYDKWTFDANASAGWGHQNRYPALSEQTYRDFDYGGRHFDEVKRKSESGNDYLKRTNSQWASLRATYRNDISFIQHMISFGRSSVPVERNGLLVSFSKDILPDAPAVDENSTQSLYPQLQGYYQLMLPGGIRWLHPGLSRMVATSGNPLIGIPVWIL